MYNVNRIYLRGSVRMGQKFDLHFIRHGITQSNLEGRYTGFADVPLCADGFAEIKELKEKFIYPEASVFFSSPLLRCKQTLNIIYPDVKDFTEVEGLKESNFGDWEGMTPSELSADELYRVWVQQKDFTIAPPNGESFQQFAERVFLSFEKLVDKILKAECKSAVIVAHGGVIMMVLAQYVSEQKPAAEWMVENGCGYSVTVKFEKWMREKKFDVYGRVPQGYTADDFDPKKIYERYFGSRETK